MFDLDTARTRVGLDPADTTQDATLQAELATALALAERYTNRLFGYAAEVETFAFVRPGSLQLRRFPVDLVEAFELDGSPQTIPSASAKLDAERGLILFDAPKPARQIRVSYTGGFVTMPADVEAALWLVFDHVHNLDSQAETTSTGEISSVTLTGVGTVRFADASREDAEAAAGLIPPRAAAILDLVALSGA